MFRIPLADVDYGPEEEAAVLRVVRSRWLSMGPEVSAFEEAMKAFLDAPHAFAVSSGTAALHLALLALDIGPGDEVIQPAVNFVAAANTTIAVGATPVFADIVDLTEPTIDPQSVRALITPRTRAVIVMHYGGYAARMADLSAVCAEHGIAIVEDACHAIGGRFAGYAPGRREALCGTAGDVGCFSFFSNKNLATGEGGLVTTGRDDLASRLRALRSHGMTTLTWDRHRGHASQYDVVAHGFNYRLDELHAALASCQLRKLTRNNARRAQLANAYRRSLVALADWRIPFADHPGGSAHHLAVVVAPNSRSRSHAASALQAAGVQTSLHYPCVADFSAFRGEHAGAALPKSREFASRVMTLPLYPTMSVEAVEHVSLTLATAAEEMSRATA